MRRRRNLNRFASEYDWMTPDYDLESTLEPRARFNEVAGDRPDLFVKWRVRYIEHLDITKLRGKDQNVRYIEVIVNYWFVTQVIDFCGNTIVPMSMTNNKLLTERLLSLYDMD